MTTIIFKGNNQEILNNLDYSWVYRILYIIHRISNNVQEPRILNCEGHKAYGLSVIIFPLLGKLKYFFLRCTILLFIQYKPRKSFHLRLKLTNSSES